MAKQAKVSNLVPPKQLAASVINLGLASFGDDCMRTYGQKTSEDRSVPDLYDGCKPVQRRILQGFLKLGARAKSPKIKTARVVGTTTGVWSSQRI